MSECRLPSGSLVGGPKVMIRSFLSQGARVVSNREPFQEYPTGYGRKVRVLAVVHGWGPYLAAGSERMLQHMLDALPRSEFDVTVMSFGVGDTRPDFQLSPYDYQGTRVITGFVPEDPPDIIITHHGPGARVTSDLATEFPNARIVAVYHNERYDIPDIQRLHADLEVFNTNWVRETLGAPGLVVHPPLEFDRHYVEKTGDRVTLVNLQENKGVRTFYALAERMKNASFMGVLGTHGEQEVSFPERVLYHPVTQDMRDVWRETRVTLMPSGYESYGMVAAESLVSGIPVIAHPTPGLVECLGHAGLFVDREDIDGYERVLNLLLTDQKHYQERSEIARLRAEELVEQTKIELSEFVDRMRLLGGVPSAPRITRRRGRTARPRANRG